MTFLNVECAFRYDLLCIEGIARALRIFLGKDKAPNYRLVDPPRGQNLIEVTVAPEVSVRYPLLRILLKERRRQLEFALTSAVLSFEMSSSRSARMTRSWTYKTSYIRTFAANDSSLPLAHMIWIQSRRRSATRPGLPRT